jgi:hypothetical protein
MTSLEPIAAGLNVQGIPMPSGSQWSAAGVSRVHMTILLDRAGAKRGKQTAA